MSHEFHDHDLIMACNSLHLTSIGFDAALAMVFRARPKRILVVSEAHPSLTMPGSSDAYKTVVDARFEVESSFAYHTMDEARAHCAFKKGGRLSLLEKFELEKQLAECEGHLLIRDRAAVTMSWWERREAATDRRFWSVCAAPPAGAGGGDHERAA